MFLESRLKWKITNSILWAISLDVEDILRYAKGDWTLLNIFNKIKKRKNFTSNEELPFAQFTKQRVKGNNEAITERDHIFTNLVLNGRTKSVIYNYVLGKGFTFIGTKINIYSSRVALLELWSPKFLITHPFISKSNCRASLI